MKPQGILLATTLAATFIACNRYYEPPTRAGAASPAAPQQGNVKLSPTAAAAQVDGSAPRSVPQNLLADAGFKASVGWNGEGDVTLVQNANDTQNAARLVVHAPADGWAGDAPVALWQDIDLACDANFVFVQYDAHLPGGENFVHLLMTTTDATGATVDTQKDYGNLLPNQPAAPSSSIFDIDAPIATRFALKANKAKHLHVQWGMNDVDLKQFPPHATPSAADGAVLELAHVSAIYTDDPNGQVPTAACTAH